MPSISAIGEEYRKIIPEALIAARRDKDCCVFVCLSENPLEWYAEVEVKGKNIVENFPEKQNDTRVKVELRRFQGHHFKLYCSGTDNRGQKFTTFSQVFIAGNDIVLAELEMANDWT